MMHKVNEFFHEHKVFFFLLLHLTSCHHTLVLKLVLSVETIDIFFRKCMFCSFKCTFGVVDIIGQRVKGVRYILAKKNKATIGTFGSKMTLQDSFTKGLASKAKYLPYISRIVDIPHNDLLSYCQQHIYRGFHNSFINIRDDLIDVRPLLNDHMISKGWYAKPNYEHTILGSTNEVIQIKGRFCHFQCLTIYCNKSSSIPNFLDF